MQYDENGNRIYGEFKDSLGQDVQVKKAPEGTIVEGGAQIVLSLEGRKSYMYPSREATAELIAALTSFLADTDGIPDLPEPDAGG